jgi:hypothetical protein
MVDEQHWRSFLSNALDVIDRVLAKRDVPLNWRPMMAAAQFVDRCIVAIRMEGDEGDGQPPGDLGDYLTTSWFGYLFQEISDWYGDRYGSAIDAEAASIKAVITILDTPFSMWVPATTTESGESEASFWLCFHDKVRNYEDPLGWLNGGPKLSSLPARDVAKARIVATEIASSLRACRIAMMGMKSRDPIVRQLLDGIVPHLERAAVGLAKATGESIKMAYWDMQMACELVLKGLTQERAGAFTETHDLFTLYDRVPSMPPSFARSELSKLPNWQRMVELRYGGGPAVSIREAFRSYRATLHVVQRTMEGIQKEYFFGNARVLFKRPPRVERI